MLAVILWILKIIGVLLLVILGLVLAFLLVVLLVPIRYRAEGSWYGELKASASVSWLLHIISLRAVYGERREIILRIFGFRIGGERKIKRKKRAKKDAANADSREEGLQEREEKIQDHSRQDREENAQDHSRQDREEKAQDLNKQEREAAEPSKGSAGTLKDSTKPEVPQKPAAGMEKTRKGQFSAGKICDKLKAAMQRISRAAAAFKNKLLGIPKLAERAKKALKRARRKLTELGKKKERLIAFLRDEENQRTFKLLKRQIFALLKHVLPRRVKGKLRFGFDDPYTTGQVLMYLAPFYGLYARKLELIPVFEEPVLDGELYLKGKVRIGTVLVLAARMMLDRNFRSLLKKWREG